MTPGFYGKLPSAGDFIGRGWSAGLRDGLDSLVRSGLGALTSEGKRLAEVLPHSPGVALVVRPGVVATSGFAGVLVPSTDRVGREFALCLGFETEVATEGNTGWLPAKVASTLYGLALRALDRASGADDLADAVGKTEFSERTSLWQEMRFVEGDDTLPRLNASAALLWMPAPAGLLAPAVRALCAMLQTSAAILGARLDAAGSCDGYFAARRAVAAAEVAAWFDGEWEARGWTVLAAPAAAAPVLDDDATRPQPRSAQSPS